MGGGSGMSWTMGSGVGVSAIVGIGVVVGWDVGEGSGSSEHADSAVASATPRRAILATRAQVFRVPSDVMKAVLILAAFMESCAN